MREGKGEIDLSPIKEANERRESINQSIGLNNIKTKGKPTLIINSECHTHIANLHKHSPSEEWLALCKVVKKGPGIFEMVDMIHPHQETSGGEVSTTDEGMQWAIDYLMEKGEDLSLWNCVLHSHHTMGCFWSGTDDNARLGLNDGRELAWAVVTAYKGDNIEYKGCLNFYKPYNIEIDCDIEHGENFNQAIDTLINQAYNNKIEENIGIINELESEYSLTNVIDYIGIDISDDLNKNREGIIYDIPGKLKDFTDKLFAEAVEETTDRFNLGDFDKWSKELIEQLDSHKKKKRQFGSWNSRYEQTKKYDSLRDFDSGMYDYPSIYSQADLHPCPDYDLNSYNNEQEFGMYKDAKELIYEWGLPLDADIKFIDGEWCGRPKGESAYFPLREVIEEMY